MKQYLLSLLLLTTPLMAQDPIKPPAIKPGDTIALVAPAGSIDEAKRDGVTAALQAAGFKVKLASNLTEDYGYLAGSDEVRASTFMDAINDPEVTALFCVRGGYGTPRMLHLLDYEAIAANPKVITGFSDITGLHLAIQAKSNVVVFHGSTNSWALARDFDSRPVQTKTFWQAIEASAYDGQKAPGYEIPGMETSHTPVMMRPGKAQGRLTGGNLSLVVALMGTPYEMESDGHILFFEEIREDPYRVDRMFSTLENSGALDRCSGVILGQFAHCVAENPEGSFTVEEIFDHYFADKPYPVIRNFPVGHVTDNAMIPLGVMAELDADAGTLRLLENPVELEEKDEE